MHRADVVGVGSARAPTLSAVRERVVRVLGVQHSESRALQLSLVCAMRQSDDVIGFLFDDRLVRSLTQAKRAGCALTAEEWNILFVPPLSAMTAAGNAAIACETDAPDFAKAERQLTRALTCTLAEAEPRRRFALRWTRATCHLATHLSNATARLHACLGSMIRGDIRRLDDLHITLDDNGPEIMMTSRVAVAVCDALCAGSER